MSITEYLVRDIPCAGANAVQGGFEVQFADGTARPATDIEVLQATRAYKVAAINAECRARLVARFGDALEQNSRAVGAYGDAEQAALKPGIEAMIDASNAASNAVLAATDLAEVEAVTVTWPAI